MNLEDKANDKSYYCVSFDTYRALFFFETYSQNHSNQNENKWTILLKYNKNESYYFFFL